MENDELQDASEKQAQKIVVTFINVPDRTEEKWREARAFLAETYGVDEDGVIPEG